VLSVSIYILAAFGEDIAVASFIIRKGRALPGKRKPQLPLEDEGD